MFADPISQRLDWRLLQNGPVHLYHLRAILDADVAELRGLDYDVRAFDCGGWSDDAGMHRALALTLGFPDYYGRNLDAFNDCLADLEFSNQGGLVLALRGFDAFVRRERDTAEAVLDILARNARVHLLLGRRLLTLVQSDDPRIYFRPVGATDVLWNRSEWLGKSRGS